VCKITYELQSKNISNCLTDLPICLAICISIYLQEGDALAEGNKLPLYLPGPSTGAIPKGRKQTKTLGTRTTPTARSDRGADSDSVSEQERPAVNTQAGFASGEDSEVEFNPPPRPISKTPQKKASTTDKKRKKPSQKGTAMWRDNADVSIRAE
jgi:hypothetical protein